MLILPDFTFGVGDRFAKEGAAQLRAFLKIREDGFDVTPVWNKSFREHSNIGSNPLSTREEADQAVKELNWTGPYFVDADHVTADSVGIYLPHADFFTLDVANLIGKPCDGAKDFAEKYGANGLRVELPHGLPPIVASKKDVEAAANKFLGAIRGAAEIYRTIEKAKGADSFVTEVSMDETAQPQTTTELYLLIAMIAEEKIPAQTIAPKFPGRFNKGVDYVGNPEEFGKFFEANVAAVSAAAKAFNLPAKCKLSVHSGSDKFSIYPLMYKICQKHGAGLHVKTAGTTWVEEVAALASVGGEGLAFAQEIYSSAFGHYDEVVAGYLEVIDIDRSKLPTPEEVAKYDGKKFAAMLQHEPGNPDYNMNARQLVHLGYKYAAKMGRRYLDLLEKHRGPVGDAVTDNIYRRHMKRLFVK